MEHNTKFSFDYVQDSVQEKDWVYEEVGSSQTKPQEEWWENNVFLKAKEEAQTTCKAFNRNGQILQKWHLLKGRVTSLVTLNICSISRVYRQVRLKEQRQKQQKFTERKAWMVDQTWESDGTVICQMHASKDSIFQNVTQDPKLL